MKKIIASLFAIVLLASPAPALAKVMIQEKGTLTIPAGQVIDDDLFIGAENVEISGVVNGSVYLGTGAAKITGTIKGDLLVGTGMADITGVILGDLYIGAGNVTLTKTTVGGSVVAGAGNLTIDKDSKIGGSLIAGSGSLKNSAPVARSVMAGAGSIYLDNTIGKEARLGGGSIELGPKAKIMGDLTYALESEDKQLQMNDSATVSGKVERFTPPARTQVDMAKAKADFGKFGVVAHQGFLLISFLGSLLLGFILLKLFPKSSLGLAQQIQKSTMASLGIGFLMIVAIIPVLLVLMMTVIGIPLAGFLLGIFMLGLCLAKLAAAYAFGRHLAFMFNWKKMGPYGVSALGLFVFFLLRALPIVGSLAAIIFTWTGLGAIWLYVKSNLKHL